MFESPTSALAGPAEADSDIPMATPIVVIAEKITRNNAIFFIVKIPYSSDRAEKKSAAFPLAVRHICIPAYSSSADESRKKCGEWHFRLVFEYILIAACMDIVYLAVCAPVQSNFLFA